MLKMIKTMVYVAILFFLVGCDNNNSRPYVKTRELVEDTVDIRFEVFDSLDNTIEIFYFKDSLKHGQNQEFYSDGTMKMEGNWYKGKKLGWFKYYDAKGQLRVLRQYISVDDTEIWNSKEAYLNQIIRFSGKGDTIKAGSFFMRLYSVGDTIKNGTQYSFKVVLAAPFFKEMHIALCEVQNTPKLLPNTVCDTFAVENYQRVFAPAEYYLGQNYIHGKILSSEKYINSSGERRSKIATIYFTDKFYVKP